MLKKTLTYEDFNGNQRTEDYYFNLTKAELSISHQKLRIDSLTLRHIQISLWN